MAAHIAGLRGMAAVHAMNKKAEGVLEQAEGMLEPLLGVDEDSISRDESSQYSGSTASSISVEVKQTAMEMLKTAAVCIGLAVGTAASAGSMIFSHAIAVFVMAGVCIVNVPYSAYKEYQIIKLPALRNLNNKLREDAIHLEESVDALSEEVDYLQPEAERATIVEEQLRDISAEQHYNVDKFVDLVKENRLVVCLMKDNVRQRIVQDVLKIVIMSDKNNDGIFSKVETKMLVLKISLQLQEYGVEFDENKFYRVMSVDPTVAQAIKIVKRLIPAVNGDEDIDDSGEGAGEGAGGSGDSGEEDDNEDAYDMFHMARDNSLSSLGSLSVTSAPPQNTPRQRRLSRQSQLGPFLPDSLRISIPSPPTPVQDSTKGRKRDKIKAFLKKK